MADEANLTKRLQQFLQGESSAVDALFREIMPELKRVAAQQLNAERYRAPLTRTELVDELWLRRLDKSGLSIEDRRHFFFLVGRTMRNILVDFARKRLAARRGSGDGPVSLEESGALSRAALPSDEQTVEIGILMERIEAKDPLVALVIDQHYFCDYTYEEIAENTGLSVKQVRRVWEKGQQELKRTLRAGKGKKAW